LPVALQEMLAGMAADELAPSADAVPFRAPGLIGYSCPHIVERRRIRQVDAAPWLAAGARGTFCAPQEHRLSP
jgi:hypothetical protein